jgi:nitroreductase
VTDRAVRAKLVEHSWGQQQIVDASHLVVFSVKSVVDAAHAEKHIARMAEVRGIPAPSLDPFKGMVVGSLSRQSPEAIRTWMTHQIYIALGMFLAAAAMIGVDACPMEGFIPEKYDEILGLPGLGYSSVVLATVGYRSADDKTAGIKKVRFPHAEVIGHI